MPNKRALIVDDSSTAQYRLKKMLRPYNLDLDTADSGEAALRYLAHHSPDVIFMDHLMPGMDGLRALQIIKSHPETAMIPVIMYTSKSGDVYTGQARALGALDVVNKDTINAVDLSKVMEAIHIYRAPIASDEHANEKPEGHITIEKISKDITEPRTESSIEPLIERRAPHPASVEQARNLELRLSHMEHTLEDSRRFITARVARELDGLRHNLKKELSELLTHNNHMPDAIENTPIYQPPEKNNSIIGKIFIILAIILVTIFFVRINSLLSDAKQQQQLLAEQINTLTAQKITDKILIPSQSSQAAISSDASVPIYKGNAYLNDLAWAFNQNGFLPFNQNNIEPKKLIQLYELLHRISNNGFKGRVWINIYVGNFCMSLDNYGIGQIPKENATMNDCVFSSEIYGLDRVMEEYTHDAETALAGLEQDPAKKLHIVINTLSEPDGYPERKPSLLAKNWNAIAQSHNRIELKLEAPATN